MAKKPKVDQSEQINSLIKALDFVSQAQRKEGMPNQTHCRIGDGWIVAYDGLLTIGHKVDEDLNARPNSTKLTTALKKCKDKFSITQLDEFKLTIKSGRFKATVDCLAYDALMIQDPDPQCAVVTPALVDGMRAVVDCLVDSPESGRAFTGAALLQADSIVGTNGYLMVEFWHGIDLPPDLLIPKKALQAIIKAGKELTGLGFCETSVTFHFADGSFIKTQTYNERYPNYKVVFVDGLNYNKIHPDFFEGVDMISGFSKMKTCYFKDGGLSSHSNTNEGAFYEGLDLPDNMAFNIDYLNVAKPYMEQVAFKDNKLSFMGGDVRGCLMGLNLE